MSRQNGHHFADDVFKCIFVNGNVWISVKNSLKFVSMPPIKNIPALVQIMACRRPGDKPLSEPIIAYFADACMRHSASTNQFLLRIKTAGVQSPTYLINILIRLSVIYPEFILLLYGFREYCGKWNQIQFRNKFSTLISSMNQMNKISNIAVPNIL